jgi:hypothetical protein
MAKKVYYIQAEFEAYLDVRDWEKEEVNAVMESIEYLPRCTFDFETDAGNYLGEVQGKSHTANGIIKQELVGNIIKYHFVGWFKIDCSKRRDKAEAWIEPLLSQGLNLIYKGVSLYTDIDTYLFRPIDSEAAEVTGISVKSLLFSKKPDGVEFPL